MDSTVANSEPKSDGPVVDLEVVGVDLNREVAIFTDPARMEKIEAHITCGGSLIDLCRLQSPGNFQNLYLQTRKWIKADPVRKAAYDEALRAREEWLFEETLSIFKAISKMDIADILTDRGAVKPVDQWPKYASICVKSFDVMEVTEFLDGEKVPVGELKRVITWDKNKTIESIGKHVRMFADKLEQSESSSWGKMVEDSFNESEGVGG